jgi:hypothetical protein
MSTDINDLATLIEDEPKTAGSGESNTTEQKSVDVDPSVKVCRHCGAPRELKYPMCRQCGFYELLNTFVEVDQIDIDDEGSIRPQSTGMPKWAWILMAILFAILMESVAVTFMWPRNSFPRMIWSLSQLAIGLIVALVAHGRATFISIMENSDNEIGDAIIRPLRVWSCVFGELPKTLMWVAMGSGGILAFLLSIFLIRSIPYNVLFETDAPPPKQTRNLANAIAEQAQKNAADEDVSMEEAMNKFAGDAAVKQEEIELPKERETSECVIVGFYSPDDRPDELSSIVVAGARGKKLEVLGTLSLDVDDDTRSWLNKKLRVIQRPKPFVETKLTARWVQPMILCEVSFTRNKKGSLRDLKFERVTGNSNAAEREKR